MKKNHLPTSKPGLTPYNQAVKESYYAILKFAKQLLSGFERDELRYIYMREERTNLIPDTVIHELISPLLYLRLEYYPNNLLGIHYGFEQPGKMNEYSKATALFIRSIYKLTSKEVTGIDIQDCVHTDWCINCCSEMFEHIEERNKHHTFMLIKHKVTTSQRKRLLSVA